MTEKLYINKLDSVRGFAAFYIFLTHFILILHFIPHPIKIFFNFGQEAVVVFFILSGFVIYLSVERNPHLTFKSYFFRRFRRIYFPLFFCIIISLLLANLQNTLSKNFSWLDLAGNLLMLQDFSAVKPGVWFDPFLDNLPLWSLGYEWWFYMIFYPIYKFLPKSPQRIYFVLFFCLISYITYIILPNHASLVLSYFIIWWSGVETAAVFTEHGRLTYHNMQPVMFSLLVMSAIAAVPVFSAGEIRLGYYPFLILRHFLDAYILIFAGIFWYQKDFVYFDKILGLFSILAPFSYSLYILQYPLLTKWDLSNYISDLWLVYTIKVAVIIILSYLIEIKFQPIINQLIK